MLSRAAYRTRQVLHALFPSIDRRDLDGVRAILSAGELRLFESMELRDQCHGIRVMEHLRAEHGADHDLLAAALVHDCGKGDVPVWLRVAYVATPRLVARLASRGLEDGQAHSAGGAGAAAFRLIHHVRLGAALAAAAGSSDATVRYISGRAAEHERAKIALLRAADDRS